MQGASLFDPRSLAAIGSVEAFERAGFTVIPAPTAFLLGRGPKDEVLPGMPNMNAAFAGGYAAHEWLGLLAQRFSR